MSKRIALYPGTFDPITKGHMDVIRCALSVTDHLILGIADDIPKTPIFTLKQRAEMAEADIQSAGIAGRVQVMPFRGLTINFAKEHQATLIIRGLRAVSDFEYEFQLASANTQMDDSIQTVFLPASEGTQFIASRLVKEIARLDGNISTFVSPFVQEKLTEYFRNHTPR